MAEAVTQLVLGTVRAGLCRSLSVVRQDSVSGIEMTYGKEKHQTLGLCYW